jgi:hypothetical protein
MGLVSSSDLVGLMRSEHTTDDAGGKGGPPAIGCPDRDKWIGPRAPCLDFDVRRVADKQPA